MKKVLKEVEGLREEVKGLKSEIVELNRENKQLQEKLAMDYHEIIYPTFDASDASAEQFDISKNKRTITIVDAQYGCLLHSDTVLPREKNSKFRVKIDHGYPGNLVVGVAVKEILKNNSLSSPGTYCLVFPNQIHLNGSSQKINKNDYFSFARGSIIGVQYIPSRNEIRFDINGEQTYMTIIDVAYQSLDIFPIVSVTGNNIKLSFI